MKNDKKSEEEMTCYFKIDIRNLTNFGWRTQKSQNLHFNGLLLTKVYHVWAKESTEELYFLRLECDGKSEEKLTSGLENDMKNLENFHQSKRKFQNWELDDILLSEVENVWPWKLQAS